VGISLPDSERILVEATSKVLKFYKYWKDVIRVTKDGVETFSTKWEEILEPN